VFSGVFIMLASLMLAPQITSLFVFNHSSDDELPLSANQERVSR
jgi:hypothetical protein